MGLRARSCAPNSARLKILLKIIPIPLDPVIRNKVASWSHRAWSIDFPGDTEQTYLDLYEQSSHNATSLPYVCVAIADDGAVIGTATLVGDDELPGFEDLNPWLAAVWVEPEHRSAGVANAMVNHIEEKASELGYKNLNLYTHDQQDWYLRHHWKIVGTGTLAHHAVTVMQKAL